MRIKTNSYKTKASQKPLSHHKVYTEKQLEPQDKVELGAGLKEKEWTLLFYNAGDGCEAKMGTGVLLDLEKVGSDENTNVVVMNYRSKYSMDRITGDYGKLQGARTYYVTRNDDRTEKLPRLSKFMSPGVRDVKEFALTGTKDIKSPVIEEHPSDINMGDKDTLKKFLVDNMKKFPAKHYAVVLSGHGSAFGGSMIVHKPEGRIRNEEYGEVFKEVKKETGNDIDLLDMNTCFSANIESVYPLKDTVKNLVASEEVVFAATQPFGAALEDLQKGIKEGKDISGKEMAHLIVEEARRQPLGNLYLKTLSAMDMEKVGAVVEDISNLQQTLMKENVPPAAIKKAMEESLRFDFSSIPKQVYVNDIGSFANEITKHTDSEKVKSAAHKLKKSLGECVFAEQHGTHAMESVTSRAFRLIFHSCKREEKLDEASGLSIYYDPDALHPDSRLDQIQGWFRISEDTIKKLSGKVDTDKLKSLVGKQCSKGRLNSELSSLKFTKEEIDMVFKHTDFDKTKYSEDVDATGFLTYVSQATEEEKAKRSFLRKGLDKFKEVKENIKKNISEKTGIPKFLVSFAEKVGTAVGMLAGINLLGAAGIPAYQVGCGSYFSVRGPLNTVKGVKDSIKLASKDNITGSEKEKIVENIGTALMGVTLGTFGLYVLGVLPRAVVWPAAIACLSVRGGKEVAKVLVSKKEHEGYKKEAEEFRGMSTSEKLDYIKVEKGNFLDKN